MRAKIGMQVCGEIDNGTIIAMTHEWCIYRVGVPGGKEIAEPWEGVTVLIDPPQVGEEASSIATKELE